MSSKTQAETMKFSVVNTNMSENFQTILQKLENSNCEKKWKEFIKKIVSGFRSGLAINQHIFF